MNKIISVLCVIFLLAAFLVGCVVSNPTDGNMTTANGSAETESVSKPDDIRPYVVMKAVDAKLTFLCNDTLIVTEYAYSARLPMSYSQDGDSAVCLTREGALLYAHDGGVEKIVDHAESFAFSVCGDAIAFLVPEDNAQEAGMESGLYLYENQAGRIRQVAAASDGEVRSYALSPDGMTLAYVTTSNYDGKLYIYQEGTSTLRMQFDTDSINGGTLYHLISINNSADIIYMHGIASLISVDDNGNKTIVGKTNKQYIQENDANKDYLFYLNADHSQLLFYNSSAYFSDQGKEAKRLSYGMLRPVQPALTVFHREENTYTCNFKDLYKQLMFNTVQQKQHLWYPNICGEFVKVESDALTYTDGYWLDSTGRYLYYRTSDMALYLVDLQKDTQSVEVSQNAYIYAISQDCSTLYYATTFQEDSKEGNSKYGSYLYQCDAKDGSEEKKIETHQIIDMYCLDDGRLIFLTSEDGKQVLYTLNPKGEAEQLLMDVSRLSQEDFGVIYVKAGDSHYVIREGEMVELEVKTME